MKGLFKKFVAAATAVCVCSGMVMPMKGSADGVLIGDVNNDGDVTLSDLTHLNRYLAGQVELVNYVSADVNQNCVVDTVDAQIILQYLTDIIPSLPYIGYGGGSSYASVGAASVNTLTGYTIFDATNGEMVGAYSLDANAVTDNSRVIIGEDTRYGDDALSGVVKILTVFEDSTGTLNNSISTGFVVDSHTIATAAHCVFKRGSGDFQDSKVEIQKILILNNLGNVQLEITGMYDVHVPNGYISKSDTECKGYDYAMITVSEDLTNYANFNLGIMTDGMISDSEKVYCTGFPRLVESTVNGETISTVQNDIYSEHNKITGEGYIQSDIANEQPERRFRHNIDASDGNSGSPVYIESVIGTTTYHTVIGIHTYGNMRDSINGGVQMTTNMLHFYKNNPNIVWGE